MGSAVRAYRAQIGRLRGLRCLERQSIGSSRIVLSSGWISRLTVPATAYAACSAAALEKVSLARQEDSSQDCPIEDINSSSYAVKDILDGEIVRHQLRCKSGPVDFPLLVVLLIWMLDLL